MKFKYNYPEHRLWRIEREYSYEISENNHFRTNGSDSWSLGNQTRIIFTVGHARLQVYYQIGLVAYQKNLDLPVNGEIVFEFTEQDQVNHA